MLHLRLKLLNILSPFKCNRIADVSPYTAAPGTFAVSKESCVSRECDVVKKGRIIPQPGFVHCDNIHRKLRDKDLQIVERRDHALSVKMHYTEILGMFFQIFGDL